jgi:phosphoadenosine phosphosulfate reductase
MEDIDKKVERALKLLRAIPADKQPVEVAFSGGKDSSVILELVKMSGIKYRAIYKNTTIDPSGNIKFCKDNGCEIINPDKSFFQLIRERGFPTRRARFCCEVLKEYKILDDVIIGVRKSESSKRDKLYNEPQICRVYGNGGKAKKDRSNVARQYFPILNWNDEDIVAFGEKYNVKFNPHYYENGIFNVKKRLGCMCCPLKGRGKLKTDFTENPRIVRLYIKNGLVWWNKQRDKEISSKKKFGTIYDLFFHNVFCDSYQDYLLKKHGLFGDLDCKEFLERYFNVKLD